ncbi:unnamed protein product [Rotaria magnacalcarata]|nr:unnamed protein product [Rotaria magnacalcarata]CAF2034885.1 unnamed protein product [Rotaria magnacalcarata]CAF2111662.1 unnamed protein product [Rotaria magnacalcarata]CAF2126287.1 unnamed protein product [Rotaria magnacalcarata]CAF3910357.1 unnamed protein product [Rotaria magnacalcarata]
MFSLLVLILFIFLIPTSTDSTVLFFHKKVDKQGRFHSPQHGNASPLPGTVWTHFQCDSKVSPFIGIGFGCYCPGAWCSNNAQCCSQMCYKKTCY